MLKITLLGNNPGSLAGPGAQGPNHLASLPPQSLEMAHSQASAHSSHYNDSINVSVDIIMIDPRGKRVDVQGPCSKNNGFQVCISQLLL